MTNTTRQTLERMLGMELPSVESVLARTQGKVFDEGLYHERKAKVGPLFKITRCGRLTYPKYNISHDRDYSDAMEVLLYSPENQEQELTKADLISSISFELNDSEMKEWFESRKGLEGFADYMNKDLQSKLQSEDFQRLGCYHELIHYLEKAEYPVITNNGSFRDLMDIRIQLGLLGLSRPFDEEKELGKAIEIVKNRYKSVLETALADQIRSYEGIELEERDSYFSDNFNHPLFRSCFMGLSRLEKYGLRPSELDVDLNLVKDILSEAIPYIGLEGCSISESSARSLLANLSGGNK